jgi:nucleotide-binding universal stress UspA family protein
MAYKSILVHVDESAGAEARVRLAAQLACENRACLVGAAYEESPPIAEIRARGAQLVAVGIKDPDTSAHGACEKTFALATAPFGIETQWRMVRSLGSVGLTRLAALADLVVCGAPQPGHGNLRIGDVIMQAGRPVLVAPPGVDKLRWGSAIFAWKNTREARRALADAAPMLFRFASVILVHVADRAGHAETLTEPAAFLKHHGIEVEQAVLTNERSTTVETLLRFARKRSVDLIALGAFGHNRAREWIFGGVTADLLNACPIPCLFSR